MSNKNKIELINELEYLIGNSCYNPNSYDGWNDIEGCSFRYPVWYGENDNRTRFKVSCKSMDDVRSMRYKFGSNHLYIGEALLEVLNYLEEKYDIDFNKCGK